MDTSTDIEWDAFKNAYEGIRTEIEKKRGQVTPAILLKAMSNVMIKNHGIEASSLPEEDVVGDYLRVYHNIEEGGPIYGDEPYPSADEKDVMSFYEEHLDEYLDKHPISWVCDDDDIPLSRESIKLDVLSLVNSLLKPEGGYSHDVDLCLNYKNPTVMDKIYEKAVSLYISFADEGNL